MERFLERDIYRTLFLLEEAQKEKQNTHQREDKTMSNGDYGYFGKGDTGYAQYMTAFNRNFGGSSGGGNHNNGGGGGDGSGCGCLIAIAVVVVLILIVMGG